ncbi:ABC transporter permease [Rhodobacter capsulatus]|jgi:spermidine/putrescine transport system permease protein|uniref:Polyamine ABC transporter, permease protein PotB-3 n=1 Tax=Rhodobacter capsulatus (strain ATCC BAA-309 / NBRC 16581 / SB1003) TaxID=272942 RepID=D5AL07_RHOCB|nr:ABC transporter permease [Rhodobacter capsulatus]ADE85997.1 polyamine ABC transporter, permease protein PotB-3 [Rhodobacter capsulatus SB 1003]ETD01094.1 ABC transporter permease [Rhodobacter capsulatus DE442]ETD75679.1 ABC transporter permease [Rhodobacter capsulatus R121]ETE53311.1 ABC transporter permease [Rhodobacter capsulatus Y262]MDS0927832.1 ABC transporter permease [Rhodobacter capsulatus]
MAISQRMARAILLAPAGLWYAVLLVLPLIVVLVYSFGERGAAGGYAPAFTLAQYANLGARWTALQNTLLLAPAGTLAALLIAYPLAYFLALRVTARWRTTLLVLVIVPFWTSILIRSYAWIFLLGGRGIPQLLSDLGLGDLRLINTPFAVLVGIVYGYLPLMVFPIYVSLEKLDRRLLEAAGDLGAPPWRSFVQITLPLSLPGVATGSMLVFILLMGEYLIPQMLGGGKVFFVGNALVDLFLQSRNWAFGSALAVTLVAIMLVTVTLYMRFLKRIGAARDDVGLM